MNHGTTPPLTYTNIARRSLATLDLMRRTCRGGESLAAGVAAWFQGETTTSEGCRVVMSTRHLSRWLDEIDGMERVFAAQEARVFRAAPSLTGSLRAAIEYAVVSVRGAASNVGPQFTDAMRVQLEMFADLLPDNEPVFEAVELNELVQRLQQLEQLAADIGLPATSPRFQ